MDNYDVTGTEKFYSVFSTREEIQEWVIEYYERYVHGLLYNSSSEIINACKSMCRWNAWLTVKWMENVKDRAWTDHDVKQYNAGAKYINDFWDFTARQRYYDEKEFWSVRDNKSMNLTVLTMKPCRLPYIDAQTFTDISHYAP